MACWASVWGLYGGANSANTARSQVAVVQDGFGQNGTQPHHPTLKMTLISYVNFERRENRRQFHHDSLLTFYARPSNSQHLYHVTEFVDSTSLRTT